MTMRRQILTGAASVLATGWARADQRPHRLGYRRPVPAKVNVPARMLFVIMGHGTQHRAA